MGKVQQNGAWGNNRPPPKCTLQADSFSSICFHLFNEYNVSHYYFPFTDLTFPLALLTALPFCSQQTIGRNAKEKNLEPHLFSRNKKY